MNLLPIKIVYRERDSYSQILPFQGREGQPQRYVDGRLPTALVCGRKQPLAVHKDLQMVLQYTQDMFLHNFIQAATSSRKETSSPSQSL